MDYLPKDPAILVSSVRSSFARLLPKGRKNVYIHSSLDWQKDDIEYAIASFVDDMNQELYDTLSDGRTDFLRDHKWFQEDITLAVLSLESVLEGRAERLENMLNQTSADI